VNVLVLNIICVNSKHMKPSHRHGKGYHFFILQFWSPYYKLAAYK